MGCPLFRGCLSIEANGKTVGTFGIVSYIMGVCQAGYHGIILNANTRTKKGNEAKT